MISERKKCVQDLVELNGPLDALMDRVGTFPWDSKEVLVILSTVHIANVLNRYLRDELSSVMVDEWANAIEVRDDIGFEPQHEILLKEVLHELANPEITIAMSPKEAKALLKKLTNDI